MVEKKNYYEDELLPEERNDPLEDTRPTGLFPQVKRGGNRLVGMMLILMAIGFTIGTVVTVLTAPSTPNAPTNIVTNTPEQIAQATDMPTQAVIMVTTPLEMTTNDGASQPLPTIDALIAQQLLAQPISSEISAIGGQVGRNLLEPFTIIPNRPRNEIIQYTVAQGDTIESIAARFGLKPETIAWSNPRRIIQVLRPGDVVNIPPVDGVFIKTFGSSTIAQMTQQYKLTDPYIVLDSPYNRAIVQEQSLTPQSTPRNGTPLFFPGGQAEEIVWQVAVEIIESTSGTTTTNNPSAPPPTPRVSFQQGERGSCPAQEIVGGAYWVNPLSGGYTITRGYASWHPGIDLAAPVGTPVKAANSGRVIFSGWNSFGYGYMIALVHGPTITIYAHLSEYYTNCGQDVVAGQVIGAVGNTGNSSGPHLHFEIRGTRNNATQDPAGIISF
jgi:murein DD-endopeptidase MepM/ murein hydrolase activator NlpD